MKKNIIILISLILLITLIFIVIFKEKDLLIIGNTTYGLTIDGIESTTLPTSGNYYLTSYTCKNGSNITWNKNDYELSIKNFNSEKESCNLTFESNPSLNEMQVGDYVAYVGNNGCLNGASGATGSSYAEAGNSCKGENANQSEDDSGYTYGYCYSGSYKYYVYGWRIAYIEDGKVYLTSAGSPECLGFMSLTGSSSNAAQIEVLNTAALDYCNATYADGGTCSSSNTWAMGNTDFQKITYAISGTKSNLTSRYGSPVCEGTTSTQRCGYNNDLIDNGGYYYFATFSVLSSSDLLQWIPVGRVINIEDIRASGLRPIIKLSSNVYVTSGSGTMEDPYQIAI